jgi:Cu-Zn family superoxide dismutase
MRHAHALPTLLAAVLVAACSSAPPAPPADAGASANVVGVAGNGISGALHFVRMGDGVHVNGAIRGLAPGSTHGFHVHSIGNCTDPANGSTDGHFNPGGQPHGGPDAAMRHAGDLPNLVAGADGVATVDVHLAHVELATGSAIDLLGKAVVVHTGRDDYTTQPAGGAGTPVACGVITAG